MRQGKATGTRATSVVARALRSAVPRIFQLEISYASKRQRNNRISGYDSVCVSDACSNVFWFQVGVIVKEFCLVRALCHQAENQFYGNPHIPDGRLSAKCVLVRRYPAKKFGVTHFGDCSFWLWYSYQLTSKASI